jgi:hypothetical protein
VPAVFHFTSQGKERIKVAQRTECAEYDALTGHKLFLLNY